MYANATVTHCEMDSLQLLWPIGIKYDRKLLFSLDAGSYMVKLGHTLKSIFPNLIHGRCLAYALYWLDEMYLLSIGKWVSGFCKENFC